MLRSAMRVEAKFGGKGTASTKKLAPSGSRKGGAGYRRVCQPRYCGHLAGAGVCCRGGAADGPRQGKDSHCLGSGP